MIQSPRLKAQTPTWLSKARYRVGNTVVYGGNYWTNIRGINSEPTISSPDWMFIGYVSPSGGGSGDITKLWKAIPISEDANEIQDADFIDAVSIDMIASSVSGNVTEGYSFNPANGTISDYPVLAGEIHVVYYTTE